MPFRTPSRAAARALTSILALAAATSLTLGAGTSASAGSALFASATAHGSDGHPYHWAAPC